MHGRLFCGIRAVNFAADNSKWVLGMIDFALSLPLYGAVVTVVIVPVILAMLARVRFFRGHNTLQFTVTSIVTFLLWYGFLFVIGVGAITLTDLALGHMLLIGALLFYMEVWALLSTGYTLAILSVLLNYDRPVSVEEIIRNYRQGEGLEWVARSRLTRLAGAGLLALEDGSVTLTEPRGVLIAHIYRICVRFLGLSRTG
jgi:hypothetical protein